MAPDHRDPQPPQAPPACDRARGRVSLGRTLRSAIRPGARRWPSLPASPFTRQPRVKAEAWHHTVRLSQLVQGERRPVPRRDACIVLQARARHPARRSPPRAGSTGGSYGTPGRQGGTTRERPRAVSRWMPPYGRGLAAAIGVAALSSHLRARWDLDVNVRCRRCAVKLERAGGTAARRVATGKRARARASSPARRSGRAAARSPRQRWLVTRSVHPLPARLSDREGVQLRRDSLRHGTAIVGSGRSTHVMRIASSGARRTRTSMAPSGPSSWRENGSVRSIVIGPSDALFRG